MTTASIVLKKRKYMDGSVFLDEIGEHVLCFSTANKVFKLRGAKKIRLVVSDRKPRDTTNAVVLTYDNEITDLHDATTGELLLKKSSTYYRLDRFIENNFDIDYSKSSDPITLWAWIYDES